MSYKIVFCGTPEFAIPSLKSLVEDPRFEIELVITQPDRKSGRGQKLRPSPIKSVAETLGLPVMSPRKVADPEVLDALDRVKADAAVVVAFGQILPQDFLNLFPKGCFNIHGSLLPRWRGAAPIQRAIMAGDEESGVSLQKIVLKLDAGDILAEKKIPLTDEIGARELFSRLSLLAGNLLCDALPRYFNGDLKAIPQNEEFVTVAAKISKQEAIMDWTQSSRTLVNKVRGLSAGGPYAMTYFRSKSLKIQSCERVGFKQAPHLESGKDFDKSTQQKILAVCKDSEHEIVVPLEFKMEPEGDNRSLSGRILISTDGACIVLCGQGGLALKKVQPESKSILSIEEFVRGYRPQEGESFGTTI